MIDSGEKKEEYRDVKEYWFSRLVIDAYGKVKMFCKYKGEIDENFLIAFFNSNASYMPLIEFKNFTHIIARNGYAKDAPTIKWEHLGIEIKEGMSEWGAEPNQKYFCLKIGKVERIN